MKQGGRYSELELGGRTRIVLRPLKRSDLPAVMRFANTLVAERQVNKDLGIVALDRRATRAREERFLSKVLAGVRKGEVVSVAAFDGKTLAGNCDVYRREPYDVRHTGVLGIAIVEGYRGKGLGEAMIRAALAEAKRLGITLVELEVFANNERAFHLYEKVGFRLVGRVPRKISRFGRRIDELKMYADLEERAPES